MFKQGKKVHSLKSSSNSEEENTETVMMSNLMIILRRANLIWTNDISETVQNLLCI